MTNTDLTLIVTFLGGLGMFLYGMSTMASGLQKSAGGKMQSLLRSITNNPLSATLIGALITAIIQSSSATTVMVVGFVNAQIINLNQAVGVIMGANVGTTLTSWFVSASEFTSFLKPGFFAPLLVAIGSILFIFAKREKLNDKGQIFVGLGLIFIGLEFMSNAIKPYASSPIFSNIFSYFAAYPLLALLAGIIVTAIIQSSSASVGILQTLAINGIVNRSAAIFITLGQNIGTCVTTLISSAGASKNAKKAAIVHLLFNVIGSTLFGIIFYFYFLFNKSSGYNNMTAVEISIFHTIFNISTTIILFPFMNLLVKCSNFLIKDSDEDKPLYQINLDERLLHNSTFAIENAISAIITMGEFARFNLKLAMQLILTNDLKLKEKVLKNEAEINKMEKEIGEYLIKIDQLQNTKNFSTEIGHLFYSINDIERIADHAENITSLSKYELSLSTDAKRELEELYNLSDECLIHALDARKNDSTEKANKALKILQEINSKEKELRKNHFDRLINKDCNNETGIYFLDIISNLKRVGDHSDNIASYIIQEAKERF